MIKESRNICINLWNEGTARIESNPDVFIIFAEFVGEGNPVIHEVSEIATDTINSWMVRRQREHLMMPDLKIQLEKALAEYLEGIITIVVKFS